MQMFGTVRGFFTLAGAGIAGLLIWVSTQIGKGTTGGYWAVYGILAGAGLTMALSQLFGGWTKRGSPRISLGVLLIGFLPVLVVGGWILLAGQPDANWFQRHIVSWSGHAGIGGLVDDLRETLTVIAFGIGLVFGFTFDTTGPPVVAEQPPPLAVAEAPAPETEPERASAPPAAVVDLPPGEERQREREPAV
jgi:hypothetical protein